MDYFEGLDAKQEEVEAICVEGPWQFWDGWGGRSACWGGDDDDAGGPQRGGLRHRWSSAVAARDEHGFIGGSSGLQQQRRMGKISAPTTANGEDHSFGGGWGRHRLRRGERWSAAVAEGDLLVFRSCFHLPNATANAQEQRSLDIENKISTRTEKIKERHRI